VKKLRARLLRTSYLLSRSYRAPEVIIGMKVDYKIGILVIDWLYVVRAPHGVHLLRQQGPQPDVQHDLRMPRQASDSLAEEGRKLFEEPRAPA
jgi:hypothetical protein